MKRLFPIGLLCLWLGTAHAAITVTNIQTANGHSNTTLTATLSATSANAFILAFVADETTVSPTASVSSFTGTAGLTFSNRYLNQNSGSSITCNQPGGGAHTCFPNFGYWCAFASGSTSGTVIANFSTTADTSAMILIEVDGASGTSCSNAFDTNVGLPKAATNFTASLTSLVTPANITGTDQNDLLFFTEMGNWFASLNPVPCTGQGWGQTGGTNYQFVQNGAGTNDTNIVVAWQAVTGTFTNVIAGAYNGSPASTLCTSSANMISAAGWVIVGDALVGSVPITCKAGSLAMMGVGC